MAELPEGYRDIPEEERTKAQKFFDYGRKASGTGNFDYAITLYLQGLEVDLCPKCGGLWLDRGEITRAAKLPEAELDRLRGLLTGNSGPPPAWSISLSTFHLESVE